MSTNNTNKPKATTQVVASYLLSEKGSKYLKFGPKRDKNKNVVGTNPFPLVINEGDVLFVNIFEQDFKEQYNVPDFVVGTIQKPNDKKEDDTF